MSGKQRHPGGYVGHLFMVKTPDTVRVGHCLMAGRLMEGDLILCLRHSGDCFQTYLMVQRSSNALTNYDNVRFGSYGVGDSVDLGDLGGDAMKALDIGGTVYFRPPDVIEVKPPKVEIPEPEWPE